jgi:membrane protein implicated in regulation of membrane protease activity
MGAAVMHFLIGALVVVAIIWFMIVSPAFRRIAVGLLVLVSLGIAWAVYNSNEETKVRQRQQAENERFAVTAIQAQDLLLADVTLKKEGAWWYLKGAITNTKYALGKIGFLVTIQDCPQPQNCKVVGQEAASTNSGSYSYNDRTSIVPAGQVRLFSSYAMEFKNMPAASNPQWNYKITEIRDTW